MHYGCMKASLERRQSNIDDRAVNESQAGTENGRGEYPESRFCSTRNSKIGRPDYGFVARRSHGRSGCTLERIRLLKMPDAPTRTSHNVTVGCIPRQDLNPPESA